MTRAVAAILADLAPRDAEAILAALEAARLAPPPGRRERLAERDDEIRRALAALYPDAAPSAAAVALQTDLDRYLASGWSREQHLDALPDGASLHRRAMHKIVRLNCGRGLSWRQLLNIRDGFRTP